MPGLLFCLLSVAAEAPVDFARDVRPIFNARCMKCHSAEKSQGGLRLDAKSHAFGPTDSGTPAIVAGKTDESELIRRVTSEDESDRMPPEGDPLTLNEVATLRRWIESGAAWPEEKTGPTHWAWTAPRRPELPQVKNAAWAKNPIDRFVLARLEKEKLQPAPEADPAVLCRRLHLDLTGLPPTPAKVEEFVRDYPQSYEPMIDKLLASPQFGERWARQWLDMARYADSNGFQRDGFRTMWAYRDWVVRAFNDDMPYTDFTLKQVAGDLLPDATLDDRIATGFNRCTTVNVEAGTDPEENRVLAVVDRVNVMSTAFLGATLACAQCHNHKYDPFTQVDYYRLLAYFNNTQAEITPSGSSRQFTGPSLPLPMNDEQKAERDALNAKLKDLEAQLAARTESAREMEAALVEKIRGGAAGGTPEWHVLPISEFDSRGGATPVPLPDNSVLLTEDNPDKDVYTVTVHTKLENITGFKLETLTDDALPGKGPGRGDAERPNFVLNEFVVRAASENDSTTFADVGLYGGTADFSQKGFEPAGAVDGNRTSGGWAINPAFHKPHWATFRTRKPLGRKEGTILRFELHQNYGGSRTIGRLRLSAQTGEPDDTTIPADVVAALEKPVKKRTKDERKLVEEYCLALDPGVAQMRSAMAKTQKELDRLKPPSTLVMVELEQPRMTAVMKRGNFLDLGPQVTPGVPESLHPLPKNAPANRLGLARWLVDPQNPLLARVAVNRWWAELMGRGIVATLEDFGTQAEPPTHPELLDWMSVELADNGWSMKAAIKTIVMSATYRQASRVDAKLLARDPYNLLYARGPRFRLPAETIRDQALASAGLLCTKMGGPPVYPPQPEGIWRVTGEVDNNYYTSTGEDRYRRGLYTIWRRSGPYPSFVNFDAPDRSACVVARPRTNTPLQALTLMNDPVYVEAAGALARRIVKEAPSADDAARAEFGFRLVLARTPKQVETNVLLETYQRELSAYRADPAKARKVLTAAKLTIGEGDETELAAWFHVANLLLNLDETVTKG